MVEDYYFSVFDLLPYFLLTVSLFFCLLSPLSRKAQSNMCFWILFLFMFFRYRVGWDYEMYEYDMLHDNLHRYDLLSKYILKLGYWTQFPPLSFGIFGFFTLYFFKKVADKLSLNPTMTWIAFFGLSFLFPASLSTLRQSLATSLLIYSVIYLQNKKILIYLLITAVASLIHSSAAAGIILLPLYIMKISRWVLAILVVASFFASSFLESWLVPILYKYFDSSNNLIFYLNNPQPASPLIYLLFLIFVVFNLIFYNKLAGINKLNTVFIKISTIGFVIYNVLIFETNTAFRVGGIFMSFWVFIVPSYGQVFTNKSKIIDRVVACLFFVLFFTFVMKEVNAYQEGTLEKNSYLPYRFWFLNMK